MAVENIMAFSKNNQAVLKQITQQSEDIFGSVGNIVKGTVSGLGNEASVTFGEHKVNVSKEVVEGHEIGDEMAFLVEDTDGKNVALKAVQESVGMAAQDSTLKTLSNTKVMHDTSQFVNLLSESDLSIDIAKEKADQVAKFSSEELRMLRKMGIDVTGSDLSHLIGLLNQFHAQQEGRAFVTASAEVTEAIAKAQNMRHLSDGSIKYMVDNHMELTYANAYMAEYSASAYPESGMTDAAWQEIAPQMEELLTRQGMEVTSDNLNTAKWLMGHDCDITQQNIALYQQIKQLEEEGLDSAQYKKNIEQQIAVGESWQTAPLRTPSLAAEAAELVKEISQLTTADVDAVAEQNQAMTIQNLLLARQQWTVENADLVSQGVSSAQQENARQIGMSATGQQEDVGQIGISATGQQENAGQIGASATGQQKDAGQIGASATGQQENAGQIGASATTQPIAGQSALVQGAGEQTAENSLTTASRTTSYLQLQEIRIRLTMQSGYQLMRLGIDIKSLNMQELIAELNTLEEEQTNAMLQESQVAITSENRAMYQQTMTMTQLLPIMPAQVLGAIVPYAQQANIKKIVEEGSVIAGNLYRRGERGYETISGQFAAYEQVMTAPRSDMGDSIYKAFANMDSMLSEMQIEANDENRKAVRILSYNQMEISEENIETIKMLDNRLMSVVDNMTPEVILGLIREGVNPLELQLDDLEQQILQQKEKAGETKEQKFSEFLYSLDKKGEITKEERSAYIGIYRMLDRITSFSGRDLGAVVKSGQELTLDHLLTSHYSRKKMGMDTVVNDEFGMLEQLENANETIKEQILSGISTVQDIMTKKTQEEETERQLQLETQIKELEKVTTQAMELIHALQQTYTPENLLAAQHLVQAGGTFYQEIADELEHRGVDKKEIKEVNEQLEQSLLTLLENVDETNSHLSTLPQMTADTSTETANQTASQSPVTQYINSMDALLMEAQTKAITAKDLSAMKQVHTMLRMTNQMCQNQQYLVPITLEEEVVTMDISIVQNQENASMTLQVAAKNYGMVRVLVTMKEQGAELDLLGENEETAQVLTTYQKTFADVLEDNNIAVNEILVGQMNENAGTSLVASYAKEHTKTQETSGVTTAFYHVAKQMVKLVRELS